MANAMQVARWVVACVVMLGMSARASTLDESARIDLTGIVLTEMLMGLEDALRFDASVSPDAPVTMSVVYDTQVEPTTVSGTHAVYPAITSFEILFGNYRIAGTSGTLSVYDNAPLNGSGEAVDFIAFGFVPDVLEGLLIDDQGQLVPLAQAQGFTLRTPTFATVTSEVLGGTDLVVPQPDEPWSVIGGGADLVQTVAPFELSHSISFGISRWYVPEPGTALLLMALIVLPGRRGLR